MISSNQKKSTELNKLPVNTKIAVVISADLDKVSQLTPNTKIRFKEVSLEDAENLFKSYLSETNKYLNEIN